VGLLAATESYGAVDCTGTITNLSLQMDGGGIVTLGLSSGPSYSYICSTVADYNGVPAGLCRTMYATLVAAKLAGKRVMFRFYSHATCAAVPNWAAPGQLGWNQLLLD
jgi:hypothetical protein